MGIQKCWEKIEDEYGKRKSGKMHRSVHQLLTWTLGTMRKEIKVERCQFPRAFGKVEKEFRDEKKKKIERTK